MPPIPPPREKPLLGTSLKLYFDLPSTLTYTRSLLPLAPLATSAGIDLFLIPDFVSLSSVHALLAPSGSKPSDIILGAQDVHSEDKGPYTGEVSAVTLKQAGVGIVEIGHAERRRLFGETNESVAAKARAVVRNGMVPLICIGELARPTASPSQSIGLAIAEIKPQVLSTLSSLPSESDVILAYEPVWAIGADKPADGDHVVAVTQQIRAIVGETKREGRCRILYGGSAGPGIWARVREGVDGLFLGRFAHDVGNLKRVIEEMSQG